jgi:vacuolar-type H+-ATPase subunit E/Vma4
MGPAEGNMELLAQAVMSEARTEADQVLSDARAKSDGIRQQAQEQATAERKQILERASQEAERIRHQAIAMAQIQARMLQLEQREKLLDRVFEAARQQLHTVQQWSDYDQIAYQLLREAVIRLEASTAVVRADETTQQLLTGSLLDRVSKELDVELRVGKILEQGTGVIVETEDGRRRYDNTLTVRLGRMQDALRSPVYRLLTGESL